MDNSDSIKVPFGWRRLYLGEVILQGDLYCEPDAPKITNERIAAEANAVWVRNGKQNGKDKENWLCAENKLLGEFWKPHTVLVGDRSLMNKISITRDFSFGTHRTFTQIESNESIFTPTSIKEKVAEYLKKFKKKLDKSVKKS